MSKNRQVQRYRNNLTGKFDGSKNMKLRFVQGLAAVAVMSILVFRFVIGTSTVDGHSMDPTLTNGQRLFFLRILPSYAVGDIISFRMPSGDYYVKRVIARQGDVVSVEKGHITVNGKKLSEPYAYGVTEVQEDTVVYPYTVGKDAYFVVGDNREHSIDSRSFGAIVKYQIRGKILGSYGESMDRSQKDSSDKKGSNEKKSKNRKNIIKKLSKSFGKISFEGILTGILDIFDKIATGFSSLFEQLKGKLPLH